MPTSARASFKPVPISIDHILIQGVPLAYPDEAAGHQEVQAKRPMLLQLQLTYVVQD